MDLSLPLLGRAAVAAGLFAMLTSANASAIKADSVFLAATHLPLLAAHVVAIRAPRPFAMAAVGLAASTGWVWWLSASAENPDERAFAPLTNLVLWVAVLTVVGFGAALRRRGRPGNGQ